MMTTSDSWRFHEPEFEVDHDEEMHRFWPWAGHRWFAYDLVRNVRPSRIIELGVHRGTSLFAFLQAVKDGGLTTQVLGVDSWKGDHQAGLYGHEIPSALARGCFQRFGDVNFGLLRMTFADAATLSPSDGAQIVHLDGCHDYESVCRDFEQWLPALAPDGLMLIHDVHPQEPYGSERFWREISTRYPGFSFSHDWGLGVLAPKGRGLYQRLEAVGLDRLARHYESYASDRRDAWAGNRQVAGRRSLPFAARDHIRYWWFRALDPAYVPPVFDLLTDAEWDVIDDWYNEADRLFPDGGECAVPAISLLQGLVMGSGLRRIVQLGHYAGFSTLLLGFMLRRMGVRRGLYSVDLCPEVTRHTAKFVERAGLREQIELAVGDSTSPAQVASARDALQGEPQLVFIDSSHQYEPTLRELALWYEAVAPGGFLVLHDVSQFAASLNPAPCGGVGRALSEWLPTVPASAILINRDNQGQAVKDLVYADGCGLGIVQKPLTQARARRVSAVEAVTTGASC